MALLKLTTCCVKTIHAVNAALWQPGEETQTLINKQTDKRTTTRRMLKALCGASLSKVVMGIIIVVV